MSGPPRPLAYAFWHWPRPDVVVATYESRQCAFQEALEAHPPEGFFGATTMRLSGAPWAAQGGAAYEDWYLVRDMAALERLNEAAVTGARKEPHDTVAKLAAGGTAGLYGLRAGAPLDAPGFASWFGKPAGMSYPVLFEALAPVLARAPAALWMRQMVLGPTPEFCLHGARPIDLPAGFEWTRLTLEPLWTGPR